MARACSFASDARRTPIPFTHAFRIPLEIAVVTPGGRAQTERIELTEGTGRFTLAVAEEPASVTLDPNTWVLMQVAEFVRR